MKSLPSQLSLLSIFSTVLLFAFLRQSHGTESAERPIVKPHVGKAIVPFDAPTDAFSSLFKREDYSCSAARPCRNGACCGGSGYCGYGPTYCGSGCVSQCNAKAECGQFASPVNKTCPLKVCCSQYGFCGTSSEFCNSKCQSNCDLKPQPKGAKGDVLDRVIGYYELWSARKDCHKVAPHEIALTALTHLNVAFAYINPGSYQITAMDTQTPASLFRDAANVKSKGNPNIKVFISLGGWTFSDNGTASQPVFSDLSSTSAKRQKFASNLLQFITSYGYDGVDIDWEYPGAGDRGGNANDTKNFVDTFKTIRETFDRSGRELGLSFTIPSSYWYLRWFDLPGLMKYADWMNLMSYDLHGVWDRNNPIGNIVQPHTNVTEIEFALQLLWRNGIPPNKVVMGFGFYGRSFELATPSCSKPGCLFSGGGRVGPCSGESGILAYYEIKELIKQKKLTPVWDKSAAVKYMTFDSNQWVSYDDADTFKQKVEWARKTGLGMLQKCSTDIAGGSLIWASDLDDDDFTAHEGLIGKKIPEPQYINKAQSLLSNDAPVLIGPAGQQCVNENTCRRLSEPCDLSFHSKVGGEKGRCGKDGGTQLYNGICCPKNSLGKCQWRGNGGDCNGQCHEGETSIRSSSWGGYPREGGSGEGKCSRGYKVFCCEDKDFPVLTKGCRKTSCAFFPSCSNDEEKVTAISDDCGAFHYRAYCCKKPSPFFDCSWKGSSPDCANAKCPEDKIAIFRDPTGESGWSCSWGRQKIACCKVRPRARRPVCGVSNACETPAGLCGEDEPLEDPNVQFSRRDNHSLSPRGSYRLSSRAPGRYTSGDPRNFRINAALTGVFLMFMRSRRYPIQGEYFQGPGAEDQLQLAVMFEDVDDCANSETTTGHIASSSTERSGGFETEHPVDLQFIQQFVQHAIDGTLPSGNVAQIPAIPGAFFRDFWNPSIPALQGLPNIGSGNLSPDTINDRVFEAMGSSTNRRPLILTIRDINQFKGRIFNDHAPFDVTYWLNMIQNSVRSGGQDVDLWAELIRDVCHFFLPLTDEQTIGVFTYMSLPEFNTRFRGVLADVRTQLQLIEAGVPQARAVNLVGWWDAFRLDFFTYHLERIRTFLLERIREAREAFQTVRPPTLNMASVMTMLQEFEDAVVGMSLP